MISNRSIKKLILLSLTILQLLNLSCGASLVSRIQGDEKNISKVKKISYEEYSLAFKDVYMNRKTDTISGTLYYVPNYTVNAELETSYIKRINAFGIGLLVDFIFLSMASVSKYQSNKETNGVTATDMLSLSLLGDVIIASWEIYSLRNKEINEKNTKDININDEKNYKYLNNIMISESLKKELKTEKLKNVSILLASDCNEKRDLYTLKVESDGAFSLPYKVFKDSTICEFYFDSQTDFIKMKSNYYFEEIEDNFFSDEVIYKYF
jgi:hypothetical protein